MYKLIIILDLKRENLFEEEIQMYTLYTVVQHIFQFISLSFQWLIHDVLWTLDSAACYIMHYGFKYTNDGPYQVFIPDISNTSFD